MRVLGCGYSRTNRRLYSGHVTLKLELAGGVAQAGSVGAICMPAVVLGRRCTRTPAVPSLRAAAANFAAGIFFPCFTPKSPCNCPGRLIALAMKFFPPGSEPASTSRSNRPSFVSCPPRVLNGFSPSRPAIPQYHQQSHRHRQHNQHPHPYRTVAQPSPPSRPRPTRIRTISRRRSRWLKHLATYIAPAIR